MPSRSMFLVAATVASIALVVSGQPGPNRDSKDSLEDFKKKVKIEHFEDDSMSLDEIFQALDMDGDGHLNMDEQHFIAALLTDEYHDNQEGRGGPGGGEKPESEDLKTFMKNAENLAFHGGKDAAEIFNFADLDGNGLIEEKEHQILASHVVRDGHDDRRGGAKDDKKLESENLDTFLKNVGESKLKFVGDKTAEDIFNYADHDGDGMLDHDEQMFMSQLLDREALAGDRRGPPPGDDRRPPPPGGDRRGPPPGDDRRPPPRGDDRRPPPNGRGPPPGEQNMQMDEAHFEKRYQARLHGQKISDIFSEFDGDGDGVLTREEEKKAVRHLVFSKDL